MIIGMTALNTGPLLSRMLDGGTGRKTRQEKNRYRITQKGEEFLVNPPPETRKKPEAKPETKVETKVEAKAET
jgi:DNA-binding PadR family transcriptional regulator